MRASLIPFVVVILGCTTIPSSPTADDFTSDMPRDCEGIRSFLLKDVFSFQQEVDKRQKTYEEARWRFETGLYSAEALVRALEPLELATDRAALLARMTSLDDTTSDEDPKHCYFKAKLSRARKLFERAVPPNPETNVCRLRNKKNELVFREKNNRFRLALPGLKEPISKALYLKRLGLSTSSRDREWLFKEFNGSRALRWSDWGFDELVRGRNEEARLAGFSNYVEYTFSRSGLDLGGYRALLQRIKNKYAPKLHSGLLSLFSNPKAYPWDLQFIEGNIIDGDLNRLLEKVPPENSMQIAARFYDALGIQTDQYALTEDLLPRPLKNPGSFALAIDFPIVSNTLRMLANAKPDVRILLNLQSPLQWHDVSGFVIEEAKAIHAAEVKQPIALFRGIGDLESEAFAVFLQQLLERGGILERLLPPVIDLSTEQVNSVLAKRTKAMALGRLFWLTDSALRSDFELSIYSTPDEDLSQLWAKLFEDYWGVAVDPFYSDWDTDEFLDGPVAEANHILGALVGERLLASAIKEFPSDVVCRELGEKVKHTLYKPGLEYNYLDFVMQFTGEPFRAEDALDRLASSP